MKKHEAVLNEVEGFGTVISSLGDRSAKCSVKVKIFMFDCMVFETYLCA